MLYEVITFYGQLPAIDNSEEITSIIVQLKQLAEKYQIVVFCTCSLNRGNEYREGKMPMFCDLSYSDAIEDVSDIVLLLHRPYFYGISEDEMGNDLTYVAEVFVPKNRNGFTGIIVITSYSIHYTKLYESMALFRSEREKKTWLRSRAYTRW